MSIDGGYQPDYGSTFIGNRHVRLKCPEQVANAKRGAAAANKRRSLEPVFDAERAMTGLLSILSEVYGEAS